MGDKLNGNQKTWLVTGAAGFIGSHIVEQLLLSGQRVIGLDNLSNGYLRNIHEVKSKVGDWFSNFRFIKGDIRSLKTCISAVKDVDYILHQAAFVSVQGSVSKPRYTHQNNVDGFQNILTAAQKAYVRRIVFASSSAVKAFECKDNSKMSQLSPYALSKYMNEKMAEVFSCLYGISTVGLRYFNVYGPRQAMEGTYAAVIPNWFRELKKNRNPVIFGDGLSTRDFCFVKDVVKANLNAAIREDLKKSHNIYEIASGESQTILQLFDSYKSCLPNPFTLSHPSFATERLGEIRHSVANIEQAKSDLGYMPEYKINDGLKMTLHWFHENC